MKASARSGSPARSSTASRITCISLRRMGTVIGSLKASAGHARQRSSLPSRTCRHQAPPPRKNRDKQNGPRDRGPFCLHPCCTFAPPSVPTMLRQSPAGSLLLRAEVETSHGYAPYH